MARLDKRVCSVLLHMAVKVLIFRLTRDSNSRSLDSQSALLVWLSEKRCIRERWISISSRASREKEIRYKFCESDSRFMLRCDRIMCSTQNWDFTSWVTSLFINLLPPPHWLFIVLSKTLHRTISTLMGIRFLVSNNYPRSSWFSWKFDEDAPFISTSYQGDPSTLLHHSA